MSEVSKERPNYRCPPPPTPYPWLVFLHGKNKKKQTFYSLSQPNKRYVRSIPELQNKSVWLSSHGWLVLCGKEFLLWNPVTFESINLPPLKLQPKQKIYDLLLTSAPGNLDSTLLVFVRNPPSIVFCCIKNQTWITRGYRKDIKVIGRCYDYKDHFCKPVICNNTIYAITYRYGHMVELEIVNSTSLVIKPLQCERLFTQSLWHCSNSYRVESCGDVFAIEVERGGVRHGQVIDIVISKLDLSKMVWNKVVSCPDRAFFLSRGNAISCPVPTADDAQRIGNRVFFTLYEDNSLYSYHIEDKTISISLPCPNISTPWETPLWILPNADQVEIKNHQLNIGQEECRKEEDTQIRDRVSSVEIWEEEKINEKITTLSLAIADADADADDLPSDIFSKISEHLTPFDYMHFRGVGKEFRSVAPPKQWRTLSASVELEKHILSPWLMLPITRTSVSSLVDPNGLGDKCKKYHLTTPQILENAIIHCSNYGWLLMSNRRFVEELRHCMLSVMLYNPLTKSTICLPDLIPVNHFFISSSPNSSDCIVVGFSIYLSQVHLIRPGMTEWIVMELVREYDGYSYYPTHIYPIFLDDSFYFLGEDGTIGVLKLEEYYTSLTLHQLKKACTSSSYHENFLVECDGELLSVFVGKFGQWVQVFKLNQSESEMEWKEVKDLGNYSLYLCEVSTIATESKASEMKNRIYFPRFDGESVMYYSLDTGRFHSSESNEEVSMDYYGSREQRSCCWIEPRWYSQESAHSSLLFDKLIRNNQ
ncbi:hypothetical protein ACH5RR_024052 [Cinchona calisaya]|uniref:F-box domain-containing protein n=1 Tax=Cinchona calisaya TaxID=153742 RepID=A0ABD2ZFR2_9GENT